MKRFYFNLFAASLVIATLTSPLHAHSNSLVAEDLLCVNDNCKKDIIALHQLARNGSYPAMTILSMIYATGDGRDVDHDKALRYLQRAANNQHPMAIFMLSEWYREGFVVEQDLQQADDLLAKAVSLKFVSAQHKKALILLNQAVTAQSNDVSAITSEAVSLLEQASEQRSVEAMFLLARLKQKGLFTHLDLEGAADLFKRLMLSGHQESKPFLSETIAMLTVQPGNEDLVAELQQSYAVEVIRVLNNDYESDSVLSNVVAQLRRSGAQAKSRDKMAAVCGMNISCNAFPTEMGPKLTNLVITGQARQ